MLHQYNRLQRQFDLPLPGAVILEIAECQFRIAAGANGPVIVGITDGRFDSGRAGVRGSGG